MEDQGCLSSEQAHALFDVLTSHVTLTEIENLKYSKTIATFGPPLQPSRVDAASTPLLRILLQSFINDLPGFRNVNPHFWTDSIYHLATALDDANLSESYDKGSVGIRRTLSTASASIIESVARGRLGGYPKQPPKGDSNYDKTSPDDIARAWDDFLQRIIYGDLLNNMFVKAAETDKLSDHEPVVQAAHQYAVTIFAALLHHNLIVSPRGQSMVSLLNRLHRLTPYFLIKQTLKIGNAASMLNGMTQLLLAKMNLSTLTSWFGGQPSDSGMNLLQQIISQVLNADTSELRKRVKQIEQSQDAPDKSQLEILRRYASQSADQQQRIRKDSESRSVSIVTAILGQDKGSPSLTEPSHKLALDYVSLQLAVRDREQLIELLCLHQPDLVTTSIRELVTVYDPIIRALHKAVDLGSGVTDLQNFLDDVISLSLIDKAKPTKLPTVQDFVRLLEKHQKSSHVFIHQALKNGKELSQWYHEYASHAIEQYKQTQVKDKAADGGTAAGDLTHCLNELMSKLPKNQQQQIHRQLDHHAAFLDGLSQQSKARMDRTIRASLASDKSDPEPEVEGSPGMFLLKWQYFIDRTPITPGPGNGPPRTGKSDSVVDATAVDVDGEKPAVTYQGSSNAGDSSLEPPDVSTVIRLLAPGFKEELQRIVASKKGKGQSSDFMAFSRLPMSFSSNSLPAQSSMEHCLQRFHHFSCIRVLDQRANTICCAISWEGLRLRQFGDKTGMMSGLKNNTLDWDGIRIILDRLKVSLGEEDSREYGLALAQGTTQEDATLGEADNPGAVNRFGRLFGKSSTAMARKTGWVKTSLEGMQELLSDSSRLIRLLYGTLETSVRIELLNAQQRLLEEAVLRSLSDSDRQMVYQLAQRTFGLEDVKNTSPKLEAYNKQLLEAIDENDERTVKYLLDQGASANTRDPLGCSPLTFSARKGRLRISEILLSRGADPKAMTTRLPQHSAAEGGHTEVLRLLLSQNSVDPSAVDSFGRTALHYASGSGNPTAVQYLLKLDGIAVDSVDEGGSTPLFAAVAKHFFSLPWGEPELDFTLPEKEIVRQLLAIPEVDPNRQHLGRFGQTLLCTALWKQAMTIVEMLLARPDIDIHKPSVSGANPIFIAIFRSNKTAVRLLLEKGANINERFLNTKVYKKFRYSTPGFWGKEFLEFALSHGKAQVARKDYSRRRIELITAAERGHTSVVRILLDCGASVSESDDQGRTALSWAAACGHEGIVEMLLSANADIHHRDNKGHTPLVLAVANLRRVPDLRDLRHSLERAELRVQRAHVNVIWSLLENYANPGDVPSTQEPPCNPARWAEAKGKFEGILEGCFGNSDDESITQNPDQPVLESSLAHTSWQEGVLAVSKPSDKDGEVYRAVEVNEVDLDRVPKPGSSTLPDDGGLAKQLRCKPNELAAEHSEGNHHSEGNKEIQAEKPIAPVLYLELEDDFSAKLKF